MGKRESKGEIMDAYRIAILVFFWNQLLSGCAERRVLVWNLNHLSANAENKTLIPKAIKNCCPLLKGKSCWTTGSLLLYAWWIANKGEEIEKGDKSKNIPPTFGIGNIVTKLIPHINSCCAKGDSFSSKDIVTLCNLAIEPQMQAPHIFLSELIQGLTIKGFISIAICNQDPLEHQIYAKKMAELGHPLYGLFHAIIGVKSESCDQVENSCPENFVPSPDHYPSESFLKTIQKIAHEKAGHAPIMLIDTKQPDGIEKYGITFKSLQDFQLDNQGCPIVDEIVNNGA